ncbi:hypothetical protein [Methylibium rhizosphaerae]|jgi:hypothetical protein|uniref:hypothetical protein n=1 Tax=Methylibium rhizosphaerae TaxID=2570323 RepID=UPI00112E4010|nr:hypothetical protein [Methylibium rhizosphaerae]
MTSTRRTALHRRAWVSSLALLALVLAQTLALVHGVVHLPSHPELSSQEAAASASADHLLGHAQGDQQGLSCQLFDQIAQAGGLPVDAPAFVPPACAAVLTAQAEPEAASQPLLAFHARGPPQA